MFDKENDDDESFFQLCMRVCMLVTFVSPVLKSPASRPEPVHNSWVHIAYVCIHYWGSLKENQFEGFSTE